MTKCAGTTQAGTACKGRPIDESQWCFVHHPDTTEERRRYGSRGGKRGGRGRPQVELAAIKTQLHDMADSVLDGSVNRADASVVGQLLNIVLRAVTVELQVKEQQDILRRLEALEEEQPTTKNGKVNKWAT